MTGKIFNSVIAFAAVAGLAVAAPAVVNAQTAPAGAQSPALAAASMSFAHVVEPAEYADQLIRDWGRGDRAAASTHATPAVVKTLFGYADPGGADWARTSTEGAAGTSYVTYTDRARGGTLTLGVSDVELSQGERQAVHTARLSRPHPVYTTGYADQLIRAWGRGDRAAASTHATPGVVKELFGYADPGGSDWVRTSAEGAAGTIYVTYRNFAGPGKVTVGVNDEAEYTGHPRAVYTVRISR